MRAYSDVFFEREGQEGRVPLPGSLMQPLYGLLSDVDGRPGRHPE